MDGNDVSQALLSILPAQIYVNVNRDHLPPDQKSYTHEEEKMTECQGRNTRYVLGGTDQLCTAVAILESRYGKGILINTGVSSGACSPQQS